MNVFGGRPMAQAGALAIVAAVCGFYFNASGKHYFAVAVLCLWIFSFLLCCFRKITPYRLVANSLVVLITLGVVYSSYIYYDVGYLNAQEFVGEKQTIKCVVTERRAAGSFYTSYIVKVTEADGKECDITAVLDCEYVCDLQENEEVYFKDVEVLSSRNIDYVAQEVLSRGIFLHIVSLSEEEYEVIGTVDSSVFNKLKSLNGWLSARLRSSIDGEVGDLAVAMLFGERSSIDDSTTRDFSRSGVSHMLAISGLHLSIITSLIGIFLSGLKLGKGTRTVMLALFITAYLLLIGFPISALRAGIMLGITFLSYFVGTPDDGLSSLGTSAWILLIFSPSSVLDYGFILSFCATFGILVVVPLYSERKKKLLDANHRKLREQLEEDPSKRKILRRKRKRFIAVVEIIGKVISACVTALGVWLIMLLPIKYIFGEMPLFFLPANLILSPSVWVFLMLSLFCTAFPHLSFLSHVTSRVGEFILDTARYFSIKKTAVISLEWDFVAPIVIATTVITAVLLVVKLRHRIAALLPAYLGMIFVISSVLHCNTVATEVRADFVSIGENDALIMTCADRAVICDFSVGSKSLLRDAFDIASKHGATEIEALILSHYHIRHEAAVQKMITNEMVRQLWLPYPETDADLEVFLKLTERAAREGISCVAYESGEQLRVFGDISLELSGPERISRSTHPIVSLKISSDELDVLYIGASAWEGERLEKLLIDGNEKEILVGAHGPIVKNVCELNFPNAERIAFFKRSTLNSFVDSMNAENPSTVIVDMQYITYFFNTLKDKK